jgi:hypothetical protein
MARVYDNPYWNHQTSGSNSSKIPREIQKHSKYHSAVTWTGGLLNVSGQGYGAFLISGSSVAASDIGHAVDGAITETGGTVIGLRSFSAGVIHDVGVNSISGSAASGGAVHLFKRRQ